MPIEHRLLRITQFAEGENKFRVLVSLEGDGPRQEATAHFEFELTPQDQEDMRWYLEDYLQYPFDPAPKIAARVEIQMAEIGKKLFKELFQSGDDARDLWAVLRDRLDDTRVEIITEVREAAAIPWELVRDPKTDVPLAMRARSFVRTHRTAAQKPQLPQTEEGPIRILLAICRPDRGDDVPFRSVASRLIKGLSDQAEFQLDVLRPPTFEQLGRVLRKAKNDGTPYHIVHFDGHGVYGDASRIGALSRVVFAENRPGKHGYLAFENPSMEKNVEAISGPKLGNLLVETDVPVLVLNACRSAHAEASNAPVAVEPDTTVQKDSDLHAQTRAFGSLAQEIMDAGAAGVVAMRYNVYVVTAAQFVADLYAGLTQGRTLGEAVSLGRKQLHDQPLREIGYDPRELQDWTVPIVYEAAPIKLFPNSQTELKITLKADSVAPSRDNLIGLPPSPDVGFFGRDETLLALDRAFDTQSIVLLHAFAGSGKTTTAAEFARWYALTGGVQGAVLFTSFEQYKQLPRVLDTIGRVFGELLEQSGIQWLTLEDADRRDVALQLMKQVPVLWIWDNVEPVTGFPSGSTSAWNDDEQKALVDFPPSPHFGIMAPARGFEVVFVEAFDDGFWIEGQTAAVEDGEIWAIRYMIVVERDFRTRRATVNGQSRAGIRRVLLETNGAGAWLVDGLPAPHLEGCLDVDLESSVFTNAFPVRRLGLVDREEAAAPAAYVRTPDLRVERLEQSYRRIEGAGPQQRYEYAAPAFDVACDLVYDEHGVVLEYPGIAVRAR